MTFNKYKDEPSDIPVGVPSSAPSSLPSRLPSSEPSSLPSNNPSNMPSSPPIFPSPTVYEFVHKLEELSSCYEQAVTPLVEEALLNVTVDGEYIEVKNITVTAVPTCKYRPNFYCLLQWHIILLIINTHIKINSNNATYCQV